MKAIFVKYRELTGIYNLDAVSSLEEEYTLLNKQLYLMKF
jgi:hypothetical protein